MLSTKEQAFLKLLGKRVATVRKQQGMTQEQLADIIDVHRTYIGFIEQGVRNPTILNLHKIAGALDVTLHDLLKRF